MRTSALLLATLIILAAVAGWYVTLFQSLDGFVEATDHGRKLFGDFVSHYLPMGKKIWTTRFPTRGFLYSPAFAMALSPIAGLPLEQAKALWAGMEVAATVLLFIVPLASLRGDRRAAAWYVAYLLLFVTTYPVLHNFRWGQVSVVNVLLVVGAAYEYRAERRLTAALLIALTLCINFYPGLILVYFLARRDRAILLPAVTASAILLVLVPAVLLGVNETWLFYDEILTKAGTAEWIALDRNSQYIGSVIRRLTHEPVLRTAGGILGGVVVGVNVYLMFKLARRGIHDAVLWSAALALLAVPFMLRTSWPHYFVYLPFVQLLVARSMVAQPRGVGGRLIEWSAVGLSILLGNVLGFALSPGWKAYGHWGCLFFADAILLLVVWCRLVPELVERRSSRGVPTGSISSPVAARVE